MKQKFYLLQDHCANSVGRQTNNNDDTSQEISRFKIAVIKNSLTFLKH